MFLGNTNLYVLGKEGQGEMGSPLRKFHWKENDFGLTRGGIKGASGHSSSE